MCIDLNLCMYRCTCIQMKNHLLNGFQIVDQILLLQIRLDQIGQDQIRSDFYDPHDEIGLLPQQAVGYIKEEQFINENGANGVIYSTGKLDHYKMHLATTAILVISNSSKQSLLENLNLYLNQEVCTQNISIF